MDPSTTIPIAMANPPRLIRLAVSWATSMKMNATSAVKGRLIATTRAERRSPSTRNNTRTTRIPPCRRAPDTVLMTAPTKSVRS